MATLLIGVTWIVWGWSTLGMGVLLSGRLRSIKSSDTRSQILVGLWVGVGLLIVVTLTLNFFVGLRASQFAAGLAAGWILIGLGSFAFWSARHLEKGRKAFRGQARTAIFRRGIVLILIVASLAIAARFAAAEPMDYDAGLYRLGLVNYAADYPIIPGLANLHGRFGFGSALGPMAAFLGNGAWDLESYRIVTGFFLTIFLVDVAARVILSSRRTPGDFFMMLGWGFIAWIVLSDSGRWIPSPAQDIIALLTAMAALAMLTDYLDTQSRKSWQASLAILVAGISGAIRPLGWLLFISILLVVVLSERLLPVRPASRASVARSLLPGFLFACLIGMLMLARDFLTSGWLLYPLSLLPMPVDWLSIDPTPNREGILWWGRAPGMEIKVAEASNWLLPWVGSFAGSRELTFLRLIPLACLLPLAWRAGRSAWADSWRSTLLGLIPVCSYCIAWFLSAPDVRFGWVGIFALGAIPLANLLVHHAYPKSVYMTVFIVLVLLGTGSEWRSGRLEPRGNNPNPVVVSILGLEVELLLGPANEIRTVAGTLGDGTSVLYPAEGENCYMTFPLCILPDSGKDIEMRGDVVSDGFRVIP